VHLWSLDAPPPDLLTADALELAQEQACGSVLSLVQAVVADAGTAPPRLWLVTRGAQPVASPHGLAPAQAPLWGLGKVIALEHPELRCVRLDLDPADAVSDAQPILDELLAPDDEDQVAIRAGTRYVARLARATVAPEPPATGAPTDEKPVRLEIGERGTLDSLALRPAPRRPPGPDEVEIRVQATGLNFKDVLNTLGMYPGDPGPLGGECAGRIVAVGSDVQGLAVGDEVVVLAPGSFGTFVTTAAAFVVPKPKHLSPEQAVTVPIAFVTARFALHHLARMGAGERVLIHAAAGGVGLAAVQLAQRVGAEVFATAGSPEKRAFLASLGVRHVFDSRSIDFADEILACTAGEGVDIVLNSLAGEFIPRSLSLLRENGRFLELGKRDHLTADQVNALEHNVGYFVIDWGETAREDPALIRSMLVEQVAGVDAGLLQPLPYRVFTASEAAAAFRYMAQAKHVGKVVVSQSSEDATEPFGTTIRSDGTYLITGGLRGLGLLVAEWLVEQGARHLALMGRAALSEHAQAVVERLEQAGAHILVARGDVSSRDDVDRVLLQIAEDLPPLCGVIHSAGVLDDGVLVQQDWARFRTVLAPKVAGAWHLHAATSHLPLDCFVLFSSLASLLGSAGQANHAAANAFLDALAHFRRAQGLPASSINWGAWAETGAAAERGVGERIAGQGMGTISPGEGLELLGRLMRGSVVQVGVAPIDWPTYLGRAAPGTGAVFLAGFAQDVPPPATIIAAPAAELDLRSRLADAPPRKQRALLVAYVQERAARVLGVASDALDARIPLNEMGLDSLMAVELRNLLGAGLGLERPLPTTLVFEFPTIQRIADYLADDVLALAPATEEPNGHQPMGPALGLDGPAPVGDGAAAALESIEGLSDEEVDRLFAEQLQGGH
jgi:polyketide synthase 12/myxalamid-type polyketide synthase MxaB